MKCSIVTIVRDEKLFFPRWYNYYSRHFNKSDIYIMDNESIDGCVDGYQNVKRVVSKSGAFDHQWLVNTVIQAQKELLQKYDVVVFAEVDEFLVHNMGLREYIESLGNNIGHLRARGFDVFQRTGIDDDMEPLDIINQHRTHWAYRVNLDKTLIITTPVNSYSLGFHKSDPVGNYGDGLMLIHTHYMDTKTSLKKQEYRAGYNISVADRGGKANKSSVEEYKKYHLGFLKELEETYDGRPIPENVLKLLDF